MKKHWKQMGNYILTESLICRKIHTEPQIPFCKVWALEEVQHNEWNQSIRMKWWMAIAHTCYQNEIISQMHTDFNWDHCNIKHHGAWSDWPKDVILPSSLKAIWINCATPHCRVLRSDLATRSKHRLWSVSIMSWQIEISTFFAYWHFQQNLENPL
jgi:hypothetical protein